MSRRSPKYFRVDWIPEAAGRKLVNQFAMIVREYRDFDGKRFDGMRLAFDEGGARLQLTLCVGYDWRGEPDQRPDEPEPPALQPPQEDPR